MVLCGECVAHPTVVAMLHGGAAYKLTQAQCRSHV